MTRKTLVPEFEVWTYVENVSSPTDIVTGKSVQFPASLRCTWRMAPSPGGIDAGQVYPLEGGHGRLTGRQRDPGFRLLHLARRAQPSAGAVFARRERDQRAIPAPGRPRLGKVGASHPRSDHPPSCRRRRGRASDFRTMPRTPAGRPRQATTATARRAVTTASPCPPHPHCRNISSTTNALFHSRRLCPLAGTGTLPTVDPMTSRKPDTDAAGELDRPPVERDDITIAVPQAGGRRGTTTTAL